MNRVKTELEERREKEKKEKERRRLVAWKDEKERKARPAVDRWKLEEEAKKVTRKMRSVGRRLEEEQRVREEMRAKDKEGKVVRERLEEERKVEEKTREVRNREWRQKKEALKFSKERRGNPIVSESNEGVSSLEEVLVGELVCSNCKVDLWKGTLFQCNEGHLACEQCKPDGCVLCQDSFQGRNKALERLREALLV